MVPPTVPMHSLNSVAHLSAFPGPWGWGSGGLERSPGKAALSVLLSAVTCPRRSSPHTTHHQIRLSHPNFAHCVSTCLYLVQQPESSHPHPTVLGALPPLPALSRPERAPRRHSREMACLDSLTHSSASAHPTPHTLCPRLADPSLFLSPPPQPLSALVRPRSWGPSSLHSLTYLLVLTLSSVPWGLTGSVMGS